MAKVVLNPTGSYTFYRDDGATFTTPEVISPEDYDRAFATFFGPLPATRRLVKKSTIIKRLHDAGRFTAAMAVLDAPANAYAKARFWAPDWGEIYSDDPEAVALLTASGADASAILAPE